MAMAMMQLSKFLQKDDTRSDVAQDEESRDDSHHNHSNSLQGSDRSKDDDDSDPPSNRKRNSCHEKDDDPGLLWRDFGGSNSSLTGARHANSSDSLPNNKTKIHPEETIEFEEKSLSSSPFDEINDVNIDLIPNLGPSDTDTTPIRSNISHTRSVSVSLEKGWKGIMVASFGAPAIPSGTSTATSRSFDTESHKSGTSDSFPISVASTAGRSFPSVDARVPVLSDDEQSEEYRNQNFKAAPYAAFVLDSMLGSGGEYEKNNSDRKEEDSLLWTWIGGRNAENPQEIGDPPTEEIFFQAGSWEDSTMCDADKAKSSNEENDNSSISETPFDENENENDLPSLSLFAASTYSRIFGIDYLEACSDSRADDEERSDEEEYIDWYVEEAPVRSTIPYGTEVTSDTSQSDGNSDARSPSMTAASSDSGSDDIDDRDWKCLERWLWITFCFGIVLVFALIVVVFSHGVQTG